MSGHYYFFEKLKITEFKFIFEFKYISKFTVNNFKYYFLLCTFFTMLKYLHSKFKNILINSEINLNFNFKGLKFECFFFTKIEKFTIECAVP